MDKDRIKGAAKEAGGKIKEKTGKMVGNRQMEAEGVAKQMEGQVQNTAGKIKDAARDAAKKSQY